MIYSVRVLRQENKDSVRYWQEFEFSGSGNSSVAEVLNELNHRNPLLDTDGKETTPIGWECGCMVRKWWRLRHADQRTSAPGLLHLPECLEMQRHYIGAAEQVPAGERFGRGQVDPV